MRPWKSTDPVDDGPNWTAQFKAWQKRQQDAITAVAAAQHDVDTAQDAVTTIRSWIATLNGLREDFATQAADGGALDDAVQATNSTIAEVDGRLGDHLVARRSATARVLGGPPATRPLLLMPLRVQAAWEGQVLKVRMYPDEPQVDRLAEQLTTAERAAAATYWVTLGVGGPRQAEQAWNDLVRTTDAQRAAWIVHTTDPVAPPHGDPRDAWDTSVGAVLMPDRFAVLAFVGGEPVDVATGSAPPRFVTWGEPISGRLPLDPLSGDADTAWATDFPTAVVKGMGVTMTVPDAVATIDRLVVVGVRGAADADELPDLLDAHAFTVGLELLPDGAPTNNSDTLRAAHAPATDAAVAAALVAPDRPQDCADGTAGAQLADLLGIPRPRVAAVAGATTDRTAVPDAVALLVGDVVGGPLKDLLGPAFAEAWPLVRPDGPAPVIRIGREPYGVLPTTAPGGWAHAATGSTGLDAVVRAWAAGRIAALDVDPANPPTRAPAPRRVTPDDESALPQILLEAASSLTWSDGRRTYTGIDGIVGPAGAQSPDTWLAALAHAAPADVPAVAATLPDSLLARIALAARIADSGAAVSGALDALARRAAQDGGPTELADLLGTYLDALSHRVDAWVTAAATQRIRAQRAAAPGEATRIGAYGVLTDVQRRTSARSQGHVHAPSLGHAATAAVLRSGYLGQRRAARVALVASTLAAHQDAQRGLDTWLREQPPPGSPAWPVWDAERTVRGVTLAVAAQGHADAVTGLAELSPLDPDDEARLPLAIDLSSRRVRQARWLLSAVRGGQPLAAVLGQEFERDLGDAALQQYLGPFRKLTRFHTGTALEQLEQERSAAQQTLDALYAQLPDRQRAAAAARFSRDSADATLRQLTARLAVATVAASPYVPWEDRMATLDLAIPDRQAKVDAAKEGRPANRPRVHSISTPD